jgi:hypothetical protein
MKRRDFIKGAVALVAIPTAVGAVVSSPASPAIIGMDVGGADATAAIATHFEWNVGITSQRVLDERFRDAINYAHAQQFEGWVVDRELGIDDPGPADVKPVPPGYRERRRRDQEEWDRETERIRREQERKRD